MKLPLVSNTVLPFTYIAHLQVGVEHVTLAARFLRDMDLSILLKIMCLTGAMWPHYTLFSTKISSSESSRNDFAKHTFQSRALSFGLVCEPQVEVGVASKFCTNPQIPGSSLPYAEFLNTSVCFFFHMTVFHCVLRSIK